MKRILFSVLLACTLAAVASVVAQVPPPKDAEAVLSKSYTGKSYSPYAQRGFPSRPFWGDTHLHTDISMDAGAFGNRLGLDVGYRFARGDEVVGVAMELIGMFSQGKFPPALVYKPDSARRQHQSPRPLEMAGRVREEDGWRRSRDCPQRKPRQRHHVSAERTVRRQAPRPDLRAATIALGAAV
jgi:hypothetical protein